LSPLITLLLTINVLPLSAFIWRGVLGRWAGTGVLFAIIFSFALTAPEGEGVGLVGPIAVLAGTYVYVFFRARRWGHFLRSWGFRQVGLIRPHWRAKRDALTLELKFGRRHIFQRRYRLTVSASHPVLNAFEVQPEGFFSGRDTIQVGDFAFDRAMTIRGERLDAIVTLTPPLRELLMLAPKDSRIKGGSVSMVLGERTEESAGPMLERFVVALDEGVLPYRDLASRLHMEDEPEARRQLLATAMAERPRPEGFDALIAAAVQSGEGPLLALAGRFVPDGAVMLLEVAKAPGEAVATRVEALESLATRPDVHSVEPGLQALRDAPEPNVARKALAVLQEAGLVAKVAGGAISLVDAPRDEGQLSVAVDAEEGGLSLN